MTRLLSPLLYFAVIAGMLGLSGCGDPSSCWDGRPISCEQARKNEINREIDKRENEKDVCMADCKSGCGCLRPRLQADGSWKIEFSNDDWRKE